MYNILISLHSVLRWLVVFSLLYSIITSYYGVKKSKEFSYQDNLTRHSTATIAHLQLVIGITLYTKSPIVKYFWANTFSSLSQNFEVLFFGVLHITLMIIAVLIITIGSSLAKRRDSDYSKFKTILIYNAVAFIIIMVSIPWPFSPLSHRPLIRL